MSKQLVSVAFTFSLFLAFLGGCSQFEDIQDPIDYTVNDTVIVTTPDPCNGHPELCDKRYNQVAYATTNRSYRYETGLVQWNSPNQEFPINRQLRDGIRAVTLDIVDINGDLRVYFGIQGLQGVFGSDNISNPLNDIAKFMADSSREVVTVFINSDEDPTAIMQAFDNAGLVDYMHVQEPTADWPTLAEMIESGKRLVVFINNETSANAVDELNYTWAWASATQEEVLSTTGFSCNEVSGTPGNSLYYLEHHVTSSIFGFPLLVANPDSAQVVNSLSNIYARAISCKISNQHQVNFISVDFYQKGDLLQTIDLLNGVAEEPF